MDKTKVIFRKFKDNDEVVAVFPAIAWSSNPYISVSSYIHIGQHGDMDADFSSWTFPATSEEYADLKAELESIGYNLKIAKRMSRKDLESRIEQCSH